MMDSLGFSLVSFVAMFAILIIFGSFRRDQESSSLSGEGSLTSSNSRLTQAQAQQIKQLVSEKKALQSGIDDALEAVQTLEQKFETLTQVNRELEVQINDRNTGQTLVSELRQQVESLTQEKHQLVTQVDAQADTQAQVVSELTDFKQRFNELTQVQSQLEADKGQLETQLAEQATALTASSDLRQQIEHLTQAKSQLESQLNASESNALELEKLRQQVERLAQEKSQLETQARDQETALTEAATLRQQLESLNQEKMQLEAQLNSQGEAVTEFDERGRLVETLRQENNDLQASLADVTTDQERLQQQVKTLIDLESTLQQQQTDAEDTLQQMQDRVTELQQQVNQLAEEKETQAVAIQQFQSDNERLEETIRLSKTTLSSLQQQVDTLTEENQRLSVSQVSPSPPADAGPTNLPAESDLDWAVEEEMVSETSTDEEPVAESIHNDPDSIAGGMASVGFGAKVTAVAPENIDLDGKSIVLTGTLIQLSPTQLKEKIQAAGGRVQGNPNSKTDYIVVGDNPGGKLQKAEKFNVIPISESDILKVLEEKAPESTD